MLKFIKMRNILNSVFKRAPKPKGGVADECQTALTKDAVSIVL